MIPKMFKLENIEKKDSSFIWNTILLPISLLLEFLYFRKYWGLICDEMITNDALWNFLDKNDFGYTGKSFVKYGLVEDYEYLQLYKDKLQETINKEFVLNLSDIIEKNSSFDLENHLILTTEVDYSMDDAGEKKPFQYFMVSIYFHRLPMLQQKFKKFIWSTVAILMVTMITTIITKILL